MKKEEIEMWDGKSFMAGYEACEKEMVQTNKFKELVKQFMIEEGYGGCGGEHGKTFKPRASDKEIESRIEFFIERNNK